MNSAPFAALADPTRQRIVEMLVAGALCAGDIAGRFFDRDGKLIEHEINHRVIGLTLDQIAAIPIRVVVAAGPPKVEPLVVAMRRGLLNVLVTDASTATALLQTPAPT